MFKQWWKSYQKETQTTKSQGQPRVKGWESRSVLHVEQEELQGPLAKGMCTEREGEVRIL